MLRSAIRSAQKAVVAALRANQALMVLLGGPDRIVAGKPKQRPHYPWIQIGSVDESDLDSDHQTFDNDGKEVGLYFDIWSDKIAQNDEVLALYELMEESLHNVQLQVVGQQHLLGSIRLVTVLVDPSNTATHGVVRYEATFHNA